MKSQKRKLNFKISYKTVFFHFVDSRGKYVKRAVAKIFSQKHLPLILPLKLLFKCYSHEIFTSSWISPKITTTILKPSLLFNKCSGFSNVHIVKSPKSTRIVRSVYTHAININIIHRRIFGSFISNEETWTTEFNIIVP